LHLRRAEAGADHEKFGERAEGGEVQNRDGGSFFILRGLDGEAHGAGKCFESHLDSFTCIVSPSRTPKRDDHAKLGSSVLRPYEWPPKPQGSPVEPLLKNVFLNARGNKSMNGLAALGSFARFRGGDVTGDGFEEIDGGLAEMRDEL